MRLNSWPPILPVGMVSGAGRAAALADGAGVWGAGLGWPRRTSGTAAEASREDVTKPRREICFAMLEKLAISKVYVKNGFKAHGRKDCPLAGFPDKMGESISMSPVILDRPDAPSTTAGAGIPAPVPVVRPKTGLFKLIGEVLHHGGPGYL